MFVQCLLLVGLLGPWVEPTLSHSGGQHAGTSTGGSTGDRSPAYPTAFMTGIVLACGLGLVALVIKIIRILMERRENTEETELTSLWTSDWS